MTHMQRIGINRLPDIHFCVSAKSYIRFSKKPAVGKLISVRAGEDGRLPQRNVSTANPWEETATVVEWQKEKRGGGGGHRGPKTSVVGSDRTRGPVEKGSALLPLLESTAGEPLTSGSLASLPVPPCKNRGVHLQTARRSNVNRLFPPLSLGDRLLPSWNTQGAFAYSFIMDLGYGKSLLA